MCAGGVLAYLVLIPAIKFFGSGLTQPLAPGTIPIGEMSPDDIRGAYILYIGAGAVATGGIISLFRVMPMIVTAFAAGLKNFSAGKGGAQTIERTDRDLPYSVVIFGCIALVAALMLLPSLHVSLPAAVLILSLIHI